MTADRDDAAPTTRDRADRLREAVFRSGVLDRLPGATSVAHALEQGARENA